MEKKEEKRYVLDFFYDADLGKEEKFINVPIHVHEESKYREKIIKAVNEIMENMSKGTLTLIFQNKKEIMES